MVTSRHAAPERTSHEEALRVVDDTGAWSLLFYKRLQRSGGLGA
jgi:hypothetical protein